jgi:hypothetical protein
MYSACDLTPPIPTALFAVGRFFLCFFNITNATAAKITALCKKKKKKDVSQTKQENKNRCFDVDAT